MLALDGRGKQNYLLLKEDGKSALAKHQESLPPETQTNAEGGDKREKEQNQF